MSDNESPSTPAPAETPTESSQVEAPVEELKESSEESLPDSSQESTDSVDPKKEKKADAAAEKVDADKVGADKYEIKVDGKVLTLNKEEMIKYAQLGKAGQKRMQEYAEYQKQVQQNWEQLRQMLKDDPESILSDPEIGHDPVELAKKILAKKAEQESKSPQELELEKYKSELEKIRKEREEEMTRREREEYERTLNQNIAQLETEIMTAIEKHNIPKDQPEIMDRIFNILETAEKNNLKVSMDAVVQVAKQESKEKLQKLTAQLSPEDLEEFLGETVLKRIKDSTLKKAKSAPKVETVPVSKESDSKPQERKKVDIKEWLKPY
jgi:hypothetical protein